MKIFFLSGFPRAGNTLLSTLLNQNPDVGCTANSLVMEAMHRIGMLKQHEIFRTYPDHASVDRILDIIYPTYFKKWKYKYIIDRVAAGTPDNLRLLKKHLNQPIKIIVLVRPLLEVLASFIKWANKEPTSFLHNKATTVEAQCDWLMQVGGKMNGEIINLNNLLRRDNRHLSLFINYCDLVKEPKKTIDQVYRFLDIPPYKHNFKKIPQFKVNKISYDDSYVGKGLHHLRSQIKIQKTDVHKLLPPETIIKYEHLKWNIIKDETL